MPERQRGTYRILRFFSGDSPTEVVRTGLTREEALTWCSNPETNSRTATSARARKVSAAHPGEEWFDGWTDR